MDAVTPRDQSIESTDEQRQQWLTRFDALSRELTNPLPVDRAAEVERNLSLLEDYARSAGLFRPEEELEFRLGRFIARWRLGEALASIERGAGPGRGKKGFDSSKSFMKLIDELRVAKDAAIAAQRIACLPLPELDKFCNVARKDGDAPTFDELLKYARPYWYKASRRRKHQSIRDRAVMNRAIIGPFPLIYADPPWQFDVYSEKGLGRTADQHYPTLSDEAIISFKIGGKSVREIASPAAALLMWCTSSNVHRALAVMEGWGFTFKSSAVWVKDRPGLGLVFRNQHELLLYGTKGEMPGPQWQPSSVFPYPVGEHSAKPPEVRAAIERMYPDFDAQTRLEIFARGDIKGWTTYGYEAD
jgi:N6-adenosine-specific RNA methylase IME4